MRRPRSRSRPSSTLLIWLIIGPYPSGKILFESFLCRSSFPADDPAAAAMMIWIIRYEYYQYFFSYEIWFSENGCELCCVVTNSKSLWLSQWSLSVSLSLNLRGASQHPGSLFNADDDYRGTSRRRIVSFAAFATTSTCLGCQLSSSQSVEFSCRMSLFELRVFTQRATGFTVLPKIAHGGGAGAAELMFVLGVWKFHLNYVEPRRSITSLLLYLWSLQSVRYKRKSTCMIWKGVVPIKLL